MSLVSSRRAGMRGLDWLMLGGCLWILASVAFAHDGHAPQAPEPQPAPQAMTSGGGTRDAQAWFTDTVLKDQNGRELRFYSDVLKDKVVMLNVIFTHCTDACPLITRKLREVRETMGPQLASQVTFVSISSDPLNDTPEVLKAFAGKQGVDGPNWLFLTGDKANVDLVLGRIGQFLPSPEQHSTQLIAGDVAGKRWSKIRPDAPPAAIAQRMQLLALPLAGR
ncbi:SCO family protein [Pseudomonas shirazica]|uniref:SCO family protein n=3 Tax=Pseudomonas TaxID=286 RepID=A0A099N005_PSEDL|nr:MULTISPECIES: SCO family protein [Pseudomonas]AHC83039.1 electron transporter SenC [Pseudomonas monteilii SB3078]AHC88415.1 electron transporter SenC [Pseudomonas monteilii SB3101]AJG13205.1 electron transporter SenC [Pseudomonas plecoglossicida]ESW37227.1 electron transporter SenC [Pseudomonas taiwanensis SJ9]KAF4561064.1 SCO family protein [Pseudomonas sp. CES]